jgi:hypothetical protein
VHNKYSRRDDVLGSRGITPRIFNVGSMWWWVVTFRPQSECRELISDSCCPVLSLLTDSHTNNCVITYVTYYNVRRFRWTRNEWIFSNPDLVSKPGLVKGENMHGALRKNYGRTHFKRTLPRTLYLKLKDLNEEINYLSTQSGHKNVYFTSTIPFARLV